MGQALRGHQNMISAERVPVSVVIPCYRCHESISSAVWSIVNQTVKPAEIILVEDFSDDRGRTLAAIEGIRSELNELIRIIVLRLPENRGAGAARNAGWSAAGQNFIAFLDADDTWHPQKLEIQIAWMLAHPTYALTCHDSEISRGDIPPNYTLEAIKVQKVSLLLMLLRNEIATRTVVVRRQIAQRFPLGARRAEDYQLWLRLLLSGGYSMRICAPLAQSYKDDFGVGGLSKNLLAMHKSILCCFGDLRRDRLISSGLYYFLVAFGVLKYWRRVVVMTLRRFKTT